MHCTSNKLPPSGVITSKTSILLQVKRAPSHSQSTSPILPQINYHHVCLSTYSELPSLYQPYIAEANYNICYHVVKNSCN